jgi:hypothetical protein
VIKNAAIALVSGLGALLIGCASTPDVITQTREVRIPIRVPVPCAVPSFAPTHYPIEDLTESSTDRETAIAYASTVKIAKANIADRDAALAACKGAGDGGRANQPTSNGPNH